MNIRRRSFTQPYENQLRRSSSCYYTRHEFQQSQRMLSITENRNHHWAQIDTKTLIGLIDGERDDLFDHILIVDCRFPYEYEGGHIYSAINIWDKSDLIKTLFMNENLVGKKVCIVFHCEFSTKRGPEMYNLTRYIDDSINRNGRQFEEVYVLKGGYKEFYETLSDEERRIYCTNPGYVKMDENEELTTKYEEVLNKQKKYITAANIWSARDLRKAYDRLVDIREGKSQGSRFQNKPRRKLLVPMDTVTPLRHTAPMAYSTDAFSSSEESCYGDDLGFF